jgi:hypothetical protein
VSGDYITSLNLWAEATWENGKKRTYTKIYDLTASADSRENTVLDYGIYVAEDNDEDSEDLMIEMANAFFDEFNAYSSFDYYWSEPWFYDCSYLCEANSHDMVISFGHGNHHTYRAGNSSSGDVDLSGTAYGGFKPCYKAGDLEYLIFASCQVLSMENDNGNSYQHFWVNNYSTRLDDRPFMGLHMVCGFRTNFVVTVWWLDNDGTDFLDQFAENLNNNMSVIDSWQEAVGDELDFDDGNNRGTVFYIKSYENDRIKTRKSDYIYPNARYNLWFDTWE